MALANAVKNVTAALDSGDSRIPEPKEVAHELTSDVYLLVEKQMARNSMYCASPTDVDAMFAKWMQKIVLWLSSPGNPLRGEELRSQVRQKKIKAKAILMAIQDEQKARQNSQTNSATAATDSNAGGTTVSSSTTAFASAKAEGDGKDAKAVSMDTEDDKPELVQGFGQSNEWSHLTILRCPKCNYKYVEYKEQQRRKNDEGAHTIFRCMVAKCQKKWSKS